LNGKVLSFYINNTLFGINITLIREINRNVEYTPVPDAPPYIVGLSICEARWLRYLIFETFGSEK
jgi:chemotaxis signal transduction protein